MRFKIMTWIMTMGLVLLMSTAVWAGERYHHRHKMPVETIVIKKYHPGPCYPRFRKHPSRHKRWAGHRHRAPRYVVHQHRCGPYYYGHSYYRGYPYPGRFRVSGAWTVPGWTFSISSGGRW